MVKEVALKNSYKYLPSPRSYRQCWFDEPVNTWLNEDDNVWPTHPAMASLFMPVLCSNSSSAVSQKKDEWICARRQISSKPPITPHHRESPQSRNWQSSTHLLPTTAEEIWRSLFPHDGLPQSPDCEQPPSCKRDPDQKRKNICRKATNCK